MTADPELDALVRDDLLDCLIFGLCPLCGGPWPQGLMLCPLCQDALTEALRETA